MIKAEQAQRIMQRYEDDYDNFLDKLKAKRKAKKENAARASAAASAADRTVAQAEARKQPVLKEKAKALLDKVGGIEGASSTAQNVMKYFKTDTPSDFSMSFGGSGEPDPKSKSDFMKTFGIGAIAVYAGGTLITLAVFYGLYRLLKKPAAPASPAVQQPVVQSSPQTLVQQPQILQSA